MKISLKFLLVSLLFFPVFVLAVSMTENTTLTLPSTGESYTLHSSSSFDSLVINTSDFSFSLSAGQSVRLSSPNKRILNNNKSVSMDCSSESEVTRTLAAGAASETFIITPDSLTCSNVGGGGGGGGGGGSSTPPASPSPSPTPQPTPVPTLVPTSPSDQALIEQLQRQIADISAQIAVLKGVPALPSQASPRAQIARALAFGSRGIDVTALQTFLARDMSVYPEGLITGFFGRLTEQAVKRFQKKHGIDQVGLTGPKTRAKLNQLMSQ